MVFSPIVTEHIKSELCTMLEMTNASLAGKYLGLPTIIKLNKKEIFVYIKDKVWRRLCEWNQKLLSQ